MSTPSPNDPSTDAFTETTATVIQLVDQLKTLIEQLTPLASPIVALFAIWAVHGLTKGRDREKAVFDVYKMLADAVAALKPIVMLAWQAGSDIERAAAVAETNWRLQQIGGYVERIRRQSRRWGIRGLIDPRPAKGPAFRNVYKSRSWRSVGAWLLHIAWPPGWVIEIGLTRAMADLRNEITADPFSDPDRKANTQMAAKVEPIIGAFLQNMDIALFAWMDRRS